MLKQHYETDVLIIGSGIAGLITALKCAKFTSVLIITKDQLTESNTRYAQGGIAAALSNNDSPKHHFNDTMKAGCYHNNPKIVDILTKEGPPSLKELLKSGLKFDTQNNQLSLAKEAAHSTARVLHNKDQTGSTIITYLSNEIKKEKNITLLENTQVIKLHTVNNTCYGAYAIKNNQNITITSIITCLGTGGIGHLFKHTSNPKIATGDGLFLGYEAGCQVIDLEFMQFHPTSFCTNKTLNTYFLISEAIRGAGAILVNHNGDDFTSNYHPDKALAPRDIVTRSIYDQLCKGNKVYLDCRNIKGDLTTAFPAISRTIAKQNLSLKNNLIPITPTAHYMMGGLLTNENSQTNITNLYAIGEVACNGTHGANRLASNSLLDGLVFANRAAKQIQTTLSTKTYSSPPTHTPTINIKTSIKEFSELPNIHNILWSQCGISRQITTLQKALKTISNLTQQLKPSESTYSRPYQHALLAKLIITSALSRHESIGSHFITPTQSSTKQYWITQQKETALTYHDSFPSPFSSPKSSNELSTKLASKESTDLADTRKNEETNCL